jgi:hypothetical protein
MLVGNCRLWGVGRGFGRLRKKSEFAEAVPQSAESRFDLAAVAAQLKLRTFKTRGTFKTKSNQSFPLPLEVVRFPFVLDSLSVGNLDNYQGV